MHNKALAKAIITLTHSTLELIKNAFWYNNSWSGFLKILAYVPKEREKVSAKKNELSFVS